MARGLIFRIQIEEGSHYPCSENKGADQLRGYREADLRLCFRICKKPVFSCRGSHVVRNLDYCKGKVAEIFFDTTGVFVFSRTSVVEEIAYYVKILLYITCCFVHVAVASSGLLLLLVPST